MIKLFHPYVCRAAVDNVTRVLESGWLGLGPETELFEKEFASYIGCKYAVGVNSGTAALQLAVESLRLPPFSRILTTPNTFVATNHVIVHAGYFPVFSDIDPNTGSLDPEAAERILKTDLIRAIMLVHYGGTPVDLDDFTYLSTKYGIPLIEDCAHAAGAEYKGSKIGKDSLVACFSFHAVKNLAIGDGGMLCTNDEEIANFARKNRWFGIDKSTSERCSGDTYSWDYDVDSFGYKAHMNDVMAAIGRGQLTKLDEHNAVRQKFASTYRTFLTNPNVMCLKEFYTKVSSNHLFVVRFSSREKKEQAMKVLAKNDIQFGYHYKPNYLYPVYRLSRDEANSCPGMEEFYATALSLPMHIHLRGVDVLQICKVINDAERTN